MFDSDSDKVKYSIYCQKISKPGIIGQEQKALTSRFV